MKFWFVHSGIEFDGDSRKRGPLGGTVTALIGVTQALAANPEHDVHVFANTPEEKTFQSVNYHPLACLGDYAKRDETDVLVVIRHWVPFWLPIKARYRVYFSPDAADQPYLHRAFEASMSIQGKQTSVPFFPPELFFDFVDSFFCVSRWQAGTFVRQLGFPEEKMMISGNGVFIEDFSPRPLEQRHRRMMYSSTPFRGLDVLLDTYAELQTRIPDVGLEVCSGMGVYGVDIHNDNSEYGHLYRRIVELGGVSHGSIAQAELAQLMCRNLVFAYPNTFPETFCISVLEAQAAGLPVVTSAYGALPERIKNGVDGFLIEGEPHSEIYKRRFVEQIVALATQPHLWRAVSEAGIKTAARQTYDHVAESWVQWFLDHRVMDRPSESPSMPLLQDSFVTVKQGAKSLRVKIPAKIQGALFQQAAQPYGFTG